MQQREFWQRRPARRLPPPVERRTHIALADLLRLALKPGWWWSHIPSGELRTEQTGKLLKRMGLTPGMGDFLLVNAAGVHHWLELKRGVNDLSEDQEHFRDAMWARGVPYAVARSYNAAVLQLQQWGAL